jgi:hypothetical protein
MEKVENNENPAKSESSYPAGYAKQWRDDEIDLVDLWIVMWSYRKLFISSVILVSAIGILCFELLYDSKPASKVRSVIEIESIIIDGRRMLVVDPDVLIKRIEFAMLSRISSLNEFEQNKSLIMATKVSRISKDSDIVEIVSMVPARDLADLLPFHGQLVDEIMLELKKSAELLTAGVHDTLFSVKSRIVNLNGLRIALEQEQLGEVNSQITPNQSLQNKIALSKANIQSEIDILIERVKYLELSLSNEGAHVLLKAGVSSNSKRFTKPVAYTMIFIMSLLLALFLTMGVIFARKVKERMATGS